MFKGARWRSEKNKIKAVFKLGFHATQVPLTGWATMTVSLIPTDAGKPTARTEKAAVIDGACHWTNPVSEAVKLVRDPKTGITNDKVYRFLVSATGSAKSGLVGEIRINLTDYADATRPTGVTLPLKAPDSGVILHVTIQRVQADIEGREGDENGDSNVREQQKKTASKLKRYNEEEARDFVATDVYSTEDGPIINRVAHLRSPPRKTISPQSKSNGNFRNSSSTDDTSASGSDSSSGQYTPKENGIDNNSTQKDSASFQSPLSNKGTPRKEITGLIDFVTDYGNHWRPRLKTDWAVSPPPNGCLDWSTKISMETGLRERLKDSDVSLDEVSELELQTLRKQLAMERSRGQDLTAELGNLKEERDALERECVELKGSQIGNGNISKWSQFDNKDPRSFVEEIKQELNHEKNMNTNLRLQLQKTQESNTELILAVKDLDELLEKKNTEMICSNCSIVSIKSETSENLQSSKFKQELFETISRGVEPHALEVLVKEHVGLKVEHSLEEKILYLSSVIELYKKDREDLEMQMEQLALDYEIMKQENHTISSRLEQTQLREQLRMQYECSEPLALVTDLEDQIRNLEKELEEQAEAFEADVETITRDKVEQEQRAIQAEEALRKTRWNNAHTAEQLKEEFERLSSQISSTFHVNEKLAMQARAEAADLRLQNCQLEESLEKTREELSEVQGQSDVKIQELLCLIDFKTKEAEMLLLDLKNKSMELENQKECEEMRQKAFSEDMAVLKAEMERLSREKDQLSEQIEQKEIWDAEMEQLKASAKETEMLLQEKDLERDMLDRELTSMREEAKKSQKELHELNQSNDENEAMIKTLNSEELTLRSQYRDLKHSLLEDEIEKENLRKQVFHLRGDLRKKEDTISVIEKKLKESSARLTASDGMTKTIARSKNNKSSSATHGSKEVSSLRAKIKLLEGKIKLKDASLEDTKNSFLKNEKDLSNRIEQLEKSISQSKPGIHEGTVHKEIENVDKNFSRANTILLKPKMGDKAGMYDLNDTDRGLTIRCLGSTLVAGSENEEEGLISSKCDHVNLAGGLVEMEGLKEKNKAMEAELKDMQERYSEISLKFAEVEGERQQLVMTIRTLKKMP